jgi:DNA-binding protein HU-beta
VNKSELIDAVAQTTGLKKTEAATAIDAVFGALVEALAKGDEVRLAGFGTFLVGVRKATEGRNPQTGEKIAIAEARVPKFRAAKALKDAVA